MESRHFFLILSEKEKVVRGNKGFEIGVFEGGL